MHVPVPLIAAAAILLLVLAWLAFRRGASRRDLVAPPDFPPHVHPPPPAASSAGLHGLGPEAEAEIRELVRARRKIEAIKRLRELRPMSLKDAKDLVERM